MGNGLRSVGCLRGLWNGYLSRETPRQGESPALAGDVLEGNPHNRNFGLIRAGCGSMRS